MIARALALLLLLLAAPARADEQIVAGLSQNRVSITADFDGSEILIYGAVKRESPSPKDQPLQVIITVEGPSVPLVVRRKDRGYGIWINNAEVRVDAAPSFYAIATTQSLVESLSQTDDLRHRISIARIIRAVGISAEADGAPDFLQALTRIRQQDGRYMLLENQVAFSEQTLFRADVALPANLTEGTYKVRIFLTRNGRVVDTVERQIGVRKEGLERLIFRSAHDQPLLYGLFSLVLAALAGWGASAAFKFIRL